MITPRPSAAALFAGAARAAQTHTCGWCLETGQGTLKFINGRLVLDNHTDCMTSAAVDQSDQCCCYEKVGDNDNCPAHGKLREEC